MRHAESSFNEGEFILNLAQHQMDAQLRAQWKSVNESSSWMKIKFWWVEYLLQSTPLFYFHPAAKPIKKISHSVVTKLRAFHNFINILKLFHLNMSAVAKLFPKMHQPQKAQRNQIESTRISGCNSRWWTCSRVLPPQTDGRSFANFMINKNLLFA